MQVPEIMWQAISLRPGYACLPCDCELLRSLSVWELLLLNTSVLTEAICVNYPGWQFVTHFATCLIMFAACRSDKYAEMLTLVKHNHDPVVTLNWDPTVGIACQNASRRSLRELGISHFGRTCKGSYITHVNPWSLFISRNPFISSWPELRLSDPNSVPLNKKRKIDSVTGSVEVLPDKTMYLAASSQVDDFFSGWTLHWTL